MIEFCANIVIILQSRFIFNSFLEKFKIKECLMWQSGIVAKWRLSENRAKLACAMPSVSHFDDVRVALSKKEKSATSLGDCGRGEINKFLFRLRVARGPCNS